MAELAHTPTLQTRPPLSKMLAMMSPLSPMMDTFFADALLSDVGHAVLTAHSPARQLLHATHPRQASLSECADKYSISIVAPGVAPSDIEIEITDGPCILIRGATTINHRTHSLNYSVPLPLNADTDNALAESADGLIMVSVPKKTKAAPTRIPISVVSDDAMPDDSDQTPYTITVVATGIAASDMELSVEDGMLSVHGATERTRTRVDRIFRLPRDADASTARASHVDGILTVHIPKTPPAEPRRIAVHAAGAAETAEDQTDSAPAVSQYPDQMVDAE